MIIDKGEFDTLCHTVMESVPNPYARTYARAGIFECYTQEEMRVQCLYILSNMTHWRGDVAKQTRTRLKQMSQRTP